MADADQFAKMPHDEWYNDSTWGYILGSEGANGAVNHGSMSYEGADRFDPTKVAEVELWHVHEGGYGPEHSAAGVFRMEDGSYVVYTGWCDSTGWGCQDDARLTFHADREAAITFGLDEETRRWFAIDVPSRDAGKGLPSGE